GGHAGRELSLDAGARGERLLLLLGRVEEHRRAVLTADVRALAVALSRVVRAPEQVEQLVVRDLLGVVGDLHGLSAAGRVGADVVGGGAIGVAAGVADAGGADAGNRPERRLDAPEAPGCECGSLGHAFQSRRRPRYYSEPRGATPSTCWT